MAQQLNSNAHGHIHELIGGSWNPTGESIRLVAYNVLFNTHTSNTFVLLIFILSINHRTHHKSICFIFSNHVFSSFHLPRPSDHLQNPPSDTYTKNNEFNKDWRVNAYQFAHATEGDLDIALHSRPVPFYSFPLLYTHSFFLTLPFSLSQPNATPYISPHISPSYWQLSPKFFGGMVISYVQKRAQIICVPCQVNVHVDPPPPQYIFTYRPSNEIFFGLIRVEQIAIRPFIRLLLLTDMSDVELATALDLIQNDTQGHTLPTHHFNMSCVLSTNPLHVLIPFCCQSQTPLKTMRDGYGAKQDKTML